MCIIVSEESDVAAFKSLTESDLGGTATSPASSTPQQAAPTPAAQAPAAASQPKKDYPAHVPGNAFTKL